jgi:hypothetical protein
VDDSALTVYAASCDKLEELGYSVEERSAELEIMLMDDETPYGGEVMVKAAAFLNMGAMTPLNELTVVMDVGPVQEQNVCCAIWFSISPRRAAFGGRSVVGRVRIPTQVFPSVDVTSCTIVRRRRQARFQSLRRTLLRAAVSLGWGSSNV